MSDSSWSSADEMSDPEEVTSSLLNMHFIELLTRCCPSRVTFRRRGCPSKEEEKRVVAATQLPDQSADGHGPRKSRRIDLPGLLRQAFQQSSATCLAVDVDDIADRVAEALRRNPDGGGETARAVTRALTDPQNGALRERVLTGRMTPEELVRLDEVSLLNPDARARLEAARLERLNQWSVAYLEKLSLTVTNLYVCPACGSHDCYANFRSTDFVKWQGDDPTPTLLKCCRCAHAFRR